MPSLFSKNSYFSRCGSARTHQARPNTIERGKLWLKVVIFSTLVINGEADAGLGALKIAKCGALAVAGKVFGVH